MSTTSGFLAGAALALVLLAPAARAACPDAVAEIWSYHFTTPFPVAAAHFDTTFTDTWTAHVAFDRAQRTLSVQAASGGRLTARVRVVESLDVTGVPAGSVVPAVLEMVVTGASSQDCGGSGCGVELEARMVAGADSVTASATQAGPGSGTKPVAETLSLPVSFLAGTPMGAQFFLTYATGPGGSAQGELAATYRVTGLPPGVEAVTCAGGSATPVSPSTWGALKSRYR